MGKKGVFIDCSLHQKVQLIFLCAAAHKSVCCFLASLDVKGPNGIVCMLICYARPRITLLDMSKHAYRTFMRGRA